MAPAKPSQADHQSSSRAPNAPIPHPTPLCLSLPLPPPACQPIRAPDPRPPATLQVTARPPPEPRPLSGPRSAGLLSSQPITHPTGQWPASANHKSSTAPGTSRTSEWPVTNLSGSDHHGPFRHVRCDGWAPPGVETSSIPLLQRAGSPTAGVTNTGDQGTAHPILKPCHPKRARAEYHPSPCNRPPRFVPSPKPPPCPKHSEPVTPAPNTDSRSVPYQAPTRTSRRSATVTPIPRHHKHAEHITPRPAVQRRLRITPPLHQSPPPLPKNHEPCPGPVSRVGGREEHNPG